MKVFSANCDGKDFDEVFFKTCCDINDFGIETKPRDQKIKELLDYTYTIKNPLSSILSNPHRKISKKYIKAEIEWYKSGDRSIEKIKEYSQMWDIVCNPNKTVNSNYGYFIWKQLTGGKTQEDWVVESLIKDKDSRQAIINFNQPEHKYESNKDFVCTISAQFFIRRIENVDKLICKINMRSQDFIFGAGNDVGFFAYAQYRILNRLKSTYPDLDIGSLITNAGSLHIYERHFEMLNKIVKDENDYESENVLDLIKEEN